jgi:hypothetical protein
MCRCLGGACAGVLLLAAAGCTLDSFLMPQMCVWGPTRVVPGSVGAISDKLQTGLSTAGLMLTCKRVGSDFRIGSIYQKRTVFCLHLREKMVNGRINTEVRMQWDRGGNEELWQLILRILSSPSDDESARSGAEFVNRP